MLIEFVIPTYDRPKELLSMLSSLLAQTNSNWKATIVCDMPYIGAFLHLGDHDELDPRINYKFLDKRYNDWGHTPREIGKQASIADYVIMTGDDNYYTPNFVQELENVAKTKPGMIYWDMVHSHYDYQYFVCQPAYNQIDMGAFATRRDLAQQIKLNTSYAADGEFVRDFNERFPQEKKVKINKVLFIHN